VSTVWLSYLAVRGPEKLSNPVWRKILGPVLQKHFCHSGDGVGIELKDIESLIAGSNRTRMGTERSSAWQYLPTLIADGILSLRPELLRKRLESPFLSQTTDYCYAY